MMPIVYLDMDGVLADLDTGMREFYFPEKLPEDRSALFKRFLPDYAKAEGFLTQPLMPDAIKLVDYVLTLRKEGKINVAILTSAGQFHDCPDMVRQKSQWLQNNIPQLRGVPFCATTSGADKCFLAHPKAILIDDWHKNITHFINAGGHGIVHTTHHKTVLALKDILNEL